MHILIAYNTVIPAKTYGGIERSIWYLGKELVHLGHKVTYLVASGSTCPFADVRVYNPAVSRADQIPDDVDVVHNCDHGEESPELLNKPYIFNFRGNVYDDRTFGHNTVFISKDHANRYGSETFVHNGMDWDDYGSVELNNNRSYFHFLGKAAWRIKNLSGAISVIHKTASDRLEVLGGTRLNINMGFRLTLSSRVGFHGLVGGAEKLRLLQGSKGLILPVRWHEPFGNAMTESLYFGCPVFGTPYGSQNEIVIPEVGFLSNSSDELALAVSNVEDYSRKRCHEYARDVFSSSTTAIKYVSLYERVLNGELLNKTRPTLQNLEEPKKLPWF